MPGEPALPARQAKDQRTPIGDRSSDGAFATAVSRGKDREQVKPLDPLQADVIETVTLDPDLDPEAAAEAVAQAVAAFIAAEPSLQPEGAPSPREAGSKVLGLNTVSTVQLRAILPELAGTQPTMAAAAASESEPPVTSPERDLKADDSVPVTEPTLLSPPQPEPVRPHQSLAAENQQPAASTAPFEFSSGVGQTTLPLPDSVPVSAGTGVQAGSGIRAPTVPQPGAAPFLQPDPQSPAGRSAPTAVEHSAGTAGSIANSPQDGGPHPAPEMVGTGEVPLQTITGAGEATPESAGRDARPDADQKSSQVAAPIQQPQQQNQPASHVPQGVSQPTVLSMSMPGQSVPPAMEQARIVPVLAPEPQASQPQRQLEIILAPPELGAVRVVITRDDGEMRIEMVASTSRAVEVLERARESMVESIRDTGMRPGPIEIRQDLNAPRNLAGGEFTGNSAWHGRQEQARQQAGDVRPFVPDRQPAPIGLATGYGTRRQGLIL